jgi:hypothetical protein
LVQPLPDEGADVEPGEGSEMSKPKDEPEVNRVSFRNSVIETALLEIDHLIGELSEAGPLVLVTLKLAYDRIAALNE